MVKFINVKSRQRTEFIDITKEVQKELDKTDIRQGVCHIYVPHTSAAVTINEGADPSVQWDILNTLSALIPHENNYTHREGNSDAHIKSSLIGAEQTVLIDGGKLLLGTWQSIFFCDFDGPRHRRVALKFISG